MSIEKMKLLVIEDNPADFRAAEEALKSQAEEEFEMVHEANFPLALKRLSEEKMDLVLLDLGLPGTSGLETLEKVKTVSSNVPLVVWTGSYDQSFCLQAMKKGALFCFSKDISSMGDLVRALEACAEFTRLQL